MRFAALVQMCGRASSGTTQVKSANGDRRENLDATSAGDATGGLELKLERQQGEALAWSPESHSARSLPRSSQRNSLSGNSVGCNLIWRI